MRLEVVTEPQTQILTTLGRLKANLDDCDPEHDSLFNLLIQVMSDHIRARLGPILARAEVREVFHGQGGVDRLLALTPARLVEEVLLDGDVQDLTDDEVAILDAEVGILRRAEGWTKTTKPLWAVRYWGGWFLPGDDIVSNTGISAAAGDQSLNLAAGAWPLVVPGERVLVSGMGEAGNNGTFTVVSRTAAKIIFADGSGIVDEAAGDAATVRVRDLPWDLEWATILLVRDAFRSRKRSGTVTREKVGPLEVTQSEGAGGVTVSAEAETILRRYERVW